MARTRISREKLTRETSTRSLYTTKTMSPKSTCTSKLASFKNSSSNDSRSVYRRACKKSVNKPLNCKEPIEVAWHVKDNVKNLKSPQSEKVDQPRKQSTRQNLRPNLTDLKTDKENFYTQNKNKQTPIKLQSKNTSLKKKSIIYHSKSNVKTNKVQKTEKATSSRLWFPKWTSKSIPSIERGKKRSIDTDIYDLEQDEDLMIDIQAAKKPQIKSVKVVKTKQAVRKRPIKEVSLNLSKQHKVVNKSKKPASQVDLTKLVKPLSGVSKYNIPLVDVNANAYKGECQFNKDKLCENKVFQEDKNHAHLEINWKNNITIDTNNCQQNKELFSTEVIQHINDESMNMKDTDNVNYEAIDVSNMDANLSDKGKFLEICTTPQKKKKKSKMHDLLSDLERSFLIPQMTSTPEEKKPTTNSRLVSKDSLVARILDIPSIVPQGGQVDLFDISLENLEVESTDNQEITLFESPVKDDEKVAVVQLQKKSISGNKSTFESAVDFLLNSNEPEKVNSKKSKTRENSKSCQFSEKDHENVPPRFFPENYHEKCSKNTNKNLLSPLKEVNRNISHTGLSNNTNITNSVQNKNKVQKSPLKITRRKIQCLQKKQVIDFSSDEEIFSEDNSSLQKGAHLAEPEFLKHSKIVSEGESLPLQYENQKKFHEQFSFIKDFDSSPVKVKVLKPRKSYQSPHEFQRYLSKAKRNIEKKKEMTREEKLMESLNNHFSELEDTVLCIE